MEIFIGNVPYDTTADQLERLLARHGRVDRVHLPVDAAGQPRGFGFATMPVPAHTAAAIAALDGSRLNGRSLRVNEAAGGNARHPRQDRRRDIADNTRPMRAAVTPVRAHTRGAVLAAATFAVVLSASVPLNLVSPWILAAYALLSPLTFLVYAIDKDAARRGNWRVAEANLHLLSLAGGWPGASVARHWLRHKTVKQPFRTVFAVTILANCAGFAWLFTADGTSAQQNLDGFIAAFASQLH